MSVSAKRKEVFIRELHELLQEKIPSAKIIIKLTPDLTNMLHVKIVEDNNKYSFIAQINSTNLDDIDYYLTENKNRGMILREILHNTLNKLRKKYITPLIKELSRMSMRPPSGNNRGGLTYRRIANRHKNSPIFASHKSGHLTRKRCS